MIDTIKALQAKKLMVRLAIFPGGCINMTVFTNEQNYYYDEESFDAIERRVKKDFKLSGVSTLPPLSLPPLPLPKL